MKKDINIPESKDIYIAAVLEKHPEYHTKDWNAYIINDGQEPVEMALIVSKGFSDTKITAEFRHQVKLLPAKSYAKIEFLESKVLALNNQFSVTYFKGSKMFEKTFLFKVNTIKPENLKALPVMKLEGILGN
ncbi:MULTISPECIES: hypothetical protein [Croceibacter]|jgi:hypothetical protein|uniref:hypothetical protein n=1 Tax=Croceibacter TaxID=216431 RepID=UPI000C3E1AC7|nr:MULTISPECIES: hypothetical protein [Croceibacter]MBG26000.1 hypothetical protein [Croceibacter sp.]WSP35213.1 hypothetical protein VVL01_03870 [Croceibacter atlanticus]|tara:strand:+ start:3588 stop:3983 length:396 start_codon:yes stop_codon:yes gene_type:complete